jgi:alkylation response protein AidB-like acyl-CoA dehydrogenase
MTVEETQGREKAMAMAEAARQEWKHPSFVASVFAGDLAWDMVHPFPAQDPFDRTTGDAVLAELERVLDKIDPDEIDRTGRYPEDALSMLASAGAFGMLVDERYGGLGLSNTNYARALTLVGSHDTATATWLSAHQSIGLPQPLRLFGTDEQKERFLPRLAGGAISAFALTEPEVGSDPARIGTTATPTPDGTGYVLDGRKLWTTNGTKAELVVVVAKTPPKVRDGKEIPQTTCFVVHTDRPGVSVTHACEFMGLRGAGIAELRFDGVVVPNEDIIGRPGDGLRIALATLNTGRFAYAAGALGSAKVVLRWIKDWVSSRVQWGGPIGHHQEIAAKVAAMAANTFAIEAVTYLTAGLADRGQADMRLESAMVKYFASETVWGIIDDAMQIRGGRGYETAASLAARGEAPVPVERLFRDARVGRIFEGSSQVMHLLIAREAVDTHFRRMMPLLQGKAKDSAERNRLVKDAASFYATWYPQLWRPVARKHEADGLSPANRAHLAYLDTTSRRLARRLVHTMARHRQKLEHEQLVLARFVDVGVDIFAMAATLSLAARRSAAATEMSGAAELQEAEGCQQLADLFCRLARARIEANLDAVGDDIGSSMDGVTRAVMDGSFDWMFDGAMPASPPG